MATTKAFANGNESAPCAECGRFAPVLLIQSCTLAGRFAHWAVCPNCARKRQAEFEMDAELAEARRREREAKQTTARPKHAARKGAH